MNVENQKLHSVIIQHIVKNGVRYDKKHGNWHILNVSPGLWFQLDSWSGQVKLQYGVPETEKEKIYWTGFGGTTFCYVGTNWGGYESRLSKEQLLEIISKFNISHVN